MGEFFDNRSISGNAGQFCQRSDTLHWRAACSVVIGLVLSVLVSGVYGQAQEDAEFGLFGLPFEEVMNIEVFSPTREAGQHLYAAIRGGWTGICTICPSTLSTGSR